MLHRLRLLKRALVPTSVTLWLIWSLAPTAAVAAPNPVTQVFVSSTDGLVRSVIVSGVGKGTQTIVGRTPVNEADSLLFEPTGKLVVTGLGFPDIYRLDPNAPGGTSNLGTQVNATPLTGSAADPAIDAAGTSVYVTSFGSAINVVNRTTGVVTTHTIAGFVENSGIAFDASGQLWVTDFAAHTVGIVNLTTNTYTPLCTGIALGSGGPDGLSFDASTGKLYVSGQANNTITQLTIGTGSCVVSHVFTLTHNVAPDGIAADGLGGIFISGQTGTLERLDTLTSAEDVIATGIAGLDDIAPVFGQGAPPGDTTAPTCVLKGAVSGGIVIAVQDSDGGLGATTGGTFTSAPSPAGGIQLTEVSNASVTIPAVAAGSTSEVDVTALKVTTGVGSSVALKVTDAAGNVTNCDPAILSVGTQAGESRTQTMHHVSNGESHVTIVNGTPGLTAIALVVDGKRLDITNLQDGETRTVDVSSLMKRGSNTVKVIAQGKANGTATVLLADS